MKTITFTILLLGYIMTMKSNAQNSFKAYNDSCYQKVKRYYSSCDTIRSDKLISKKSFRIDKKLIKLISEIYQNELFSIMMLNQKTSNYKNATITQKENIIEFWTHTEGNLYVSIKATIKNNILQEKKIYIATKSQVMYNNDYMYVNALDFLYLYKFETFIKFPTAFQSNQSSLEIVQNN